MNSTRRKIQIAHQRSASPEPQVGQSSRTSHPTQPIQKPNYQAQFVPRHDHSPRQEDRSPESPENSRTLGTPSGHSESVSTIMTSSFKNEEEWETSAQPFKAPDGSAKWQASVCQQIQLSNLIMNPLVPVENLRQWEGVSVYVHCEETTGQTTR